ncbi:MAG: PQ-loop domain-containing transporter [Candidatus Dependentiae bacterium]|jgi:uncharacterized protein with PQ loop repeat
MLTQTQLAELLLWGPCVLNILGVWSQIKHNYELRSTHGISYLMLGIFHFAALCLCMYIYLMDLPFALKVMVPIEVLAITVMVGQEMWYAPTLLFRAQVMVLHGGIVALITLLWLLGFSYSFIVGNVAGWAATAALALVQLPQIVRTWRCKSTHGFSTGILVYGTLSPLLILWCCYQLTMPLQSWVNASRALVYRVIQWCQFLVYPRDRH